MFSLWWQDCSLQYCTLFSVGTFSFLSHWSKVVMSSHTTVIHKVEVIRSVLCTGYKAISCISLTPGECVNRERNTLFLFKQTYQM